MEDEYVRASIKMRVSALGSPNAASRGGMFADAFASADAGSGPGRPANTNGSDQELLGSVDGKMSQRASRSKSSNTGTDSLIESVRGPSSEEETTFLALQEQRRIEEELRNEFKQKHGLCLCGLAMFFLTSLSGLCSDIRRSEKQKASLDPSTDDDEQESRWSDDARFPG